MRALSLLLLCALQLWTTALGGPKSLQFVLNHNGQSKLMQVSNFQWSNCGPSSNPSVVKSLSVSPDPIEIPGNVQVGIVAATTMALEAPVKLEMILEKKMGNIWLKVPCVDDVGSCVYPNFCAILDSMFPPGQPCPEPLQSYGLPCHCPFKAGTYCLPSSDFYIPKMDLPSFLTNGEYKTQILLSMGDQQLACFKMSYALKAPNKVFW